VGHKNKYKDDRILLIDVSVVTYMDNDRHLEANKMIPYGAYIINRQLIELQPLITPWTADIQVFIIIT
jgi:hypothetical protein